MKFIDLEVLCSKTSTSHPDSYSSLLEELNIETDKEYYWKTVLFNVKPLEEEMFAIEARESNKEHSIINFYGGDNSVIINMPVEKLKKKLNEIINT